VLKRMNELWPGLIDRLCAEERKEKAEKEEGEEGTNEEGKGVESEKGEDEGKNEQPE
jgi:hypothetical protein